jgi:hypothetical protein
MYQALPITPDLEELIGETASRLGGKSHELFEEGELFLYELTEECKRLAIAITEAKVWVRKLQQPIQN